MVTITLSIDDETMERARAAAGARHQTLEEIVATLVHDLGKSSQGYQRASDVSGGGTSGDGDLVGLFADEPGLADAIDEEAASLRAERWARAGGE